MINISATKVRKIRKAARAYDLAIAHTKEQLALQLGLTLESVEKVWKEYGDDA